MTTRYNKARQMFDATRRRDVQRARCGDAVRKGKPFAAMLHALSAALYEAVAYYRQCELQVEQERAPTREPLPTSHREMN